MHLLYFPANAAYAFVFGSTVEDANLCNLHGFPMFYQTKGEAIEAARHRGLSVDLKTGLVSIDARANDEQPNKPEPVKMDVAQWYAMLAEDDRQLMVRPYGGISYGTAMSFQSLSKQAQAAVTRAYTSFAAIIAKT